MFRAPSFYNVVEFAEMFGMSPGYVRHGARAFITPTADNRAKLPAGYGAFMWSGSQVIFDLADTEIIERMFNVSVNAVPKADTHA